MKTLKKRARNSFDADDLHKLDQVHASLCKNLHQLASLNENFKDVLSLKSERQTKLVLKNPENKIFAK